MNFFFRSFYTVENKNSLIIFSCTKTINSTTHLKPLILTPIDIFFVLRLAGCHERGVLAPCRERHPRIVEYLERRGVVILVVEVKGWGFRVGSVSRKAACVGSTGCVLCKHIAWVSSLVLKLEAFWLNLLFKP